MPSATAKMQVKYKRQVTAQSKQHSDMQEAVRPTVFATFEDSPGDPAGGSASASGSVSGQSSFESEASSIADSVRIFFGRTGFRKYDRKKN
jgi:hypothetical protein